MSKLQGDQAGRSAAELTYRDAGVDIDAGNLAVQRIRSLVASTRQPEQIGDLGGFAGLFGLPAGLADPVMVACTDGVGTKLLVAITCERHDTVGIDLVAMSVNDLIVSGARPLFVLDYIACGHYALAAVAVGVVDRPALLGPSKVRAGDVVLGLPSSGLHSNGYSLARKALLDPEYAGLAYDDALPGGGGETVADALLRPTRIYVDSVTYARDFDGAPLHGAAHITGGGLWENPQRAVAEDLAVHLDLRELRPPPVFAAIAAQGVSCDEMLRTFNCGVGMLLYVDPSRASDLRDALRDRGEEVMTLGEVVPRVGDGPQVVISGSDLFTGAG